MTPEEERWAEAIAGDRLRGAMTPAIIEERVRTLTLAGDERGAMRWRQIAARYDQLRGGTVQ